MILSPLISTVRLMHEIHHDEASAILAALKLESDRLHLADSLGPS